MNVADAMTPRSDLVTVTLPGTRDDALEYLQERTFSSLPVVTEGEDGEEFRGLVTREALIAHPDEDQLALLVEETPRITAEESVEAAGRLIAETGERRIPVVDEGLAGIVTITDVIRAIATGAVDGDTEVGELARRDVNCVYAGTPLVVAERELSHADVPYAVVLEADGRTCGMLTEVDIIDVAEVVEGEARTGESIANQDDEWMWEGIKAVGNRYMPTRNVEFPDGSVEEFMTADLLTVGGTRSAREVAQLLIEEDIEQVPLMSGDELAGIVRDVDLLGAL
jgi:IMP dehydrogenase